MKGMSVTAVEMGARQREISVSEFFTKNRHLLGFDNPRKALLTCVKEAVDNALDASEEAGILPDVVVTLEVVPTGGATPPASQATRFRVTITDNGPGIVRQQIPPIFAKLLYGSKFHRLRMSRGQQGIGISAAGMYAQLTTGKPVQITSRTGPRAAAHYFEVSIDTKKNEPRIFESKKIEWEHPRGTQVSLEIEGRYQKGRASVDEYLEQTAIANPHVDLVYHTPEGETRKFPRTIQELPPQPKEIKPHPYGIEFGVLLRMLQDTTSHSLAGFLAGDFSRVSPAVAAEICKTAKLSADARPRNVHGEDAEALYKAIQTTKIMAPPSNCISPIGEKAILHGLYKQIKGDFYTAVTRPPSVYRGNPFIIEAGLAFGKGSAGRGYGHPGGAGGAAGRGRAARERRRAGPRHPVRQPRAAALPAVGVRDVQGGAGDRVEELRHRAVARRAAGRSHGDLRPHGLGVGAVHQRVQGSHRDYDEIRKDIKLALQECGRRLGRVPAPARAGQERVPAAQHLRALHRGGCRGLRPAQGRQAGQGQAQGPAPEDRRQAHGRRQDRRDPRPRHRPGGAAALDHRDAGWAGG
jgi:DNA topoisomerase-6 subunit B